jgi:iron complex outermembrane receptor protein
MNNHLKLLEEFRIPSDGFIDRAASDLKSYFFVGKLFGIKTLWQGVGIWRNRENVHQSWNGVKILDKLKQPGPTMHFRRITLTTMAI